MSTKRIAVLLLLAALLGTGFILSNRARQGARSARPEALSPTKPHLSAPSAPAAQPGSATRRPAEFHKVVSDTDPRLADVYWSEGEPSTAYDLLRHLKYPADTRRGPSLPGANLLRLENSEGILKFFLSPSGKYVAVAIQSTGTARFSGQSDLWLLSVKDHKHRALTNDYAGYTQVQWSEDESKIAYVSMEGVWRSPDSDWRAPFAVYIQDVRNGRRRKLFQEHPQKSDQKLNGGDQLLRWIGNRYLLYVSVHPPGLYLLDIASGARVRLARHSPLIDAMPDGLSLQSRRLFWWDAAKHMLQIADLPTNTARLLRPATWGAVKANVSFALPTAPEEVSISPDGRSIAVLVAIDSLASAPRQLALLDFHTGQVRPLGMVRNIVSSSLRWARDRRHVLLVGRESSGEGAILNSIATGSAMPRQMKMVDWHDPTLAKRVPLVTLPAGAQQVEWIEAH